MKILDNEPLSKYTAFKVGGPAEKLIILNSAQDIAEIKAHIKEPYQVLGYGTNCVISDDGLDGTVLMLRDGPVPDIKNDVLIVDGATNWDLAVEHSVEHGLWGIELMSGIPGNVGAALSGNIAAYGQPISDTFLWAEAFDPKVSQMVKLAKSDIEFSYRQSSLQTKQNHLIISRVALQLSKKPTMDLAYASALNVANQLEIAPDSLSSRRKIILETRKRAGSIYDEADPDQESTAGSFFKNPIVDEGTARRLAKFDESGKTIDELLEQNHIHGGDDFRVSAAHVLLAAGFKRGQSWGNVRLHPKHVLKIENAGNATARQIHDAAEDIIAAVKTKLGITLEAEVRFIGQFS